jgi:hypothetical protein
MDDPEKPTRWIDYPLLACIREILTTSFSEF